MVKRLLVGLRERGLDVTQPILFVLDGAKALSSAVHAVFDHPVIARCQLHKVRNVRRLPARQRGPMVERRMRAAYRNPDPLAGQGDLEALAKELERSHPGAAGFPARGTGRDVHRRPPRRSADAGPHAALDQCHRVHDRDLP